MYQGAILCNMSAFKAHCAFGFWNGGTMFPAGQKEAMGHLGRISALSDLPPPETLHTYIRQAMTLSEAGVVRARPKTAPRALLVPAYFAEALKANQAARQVFDAGSLSFRREYVDWLEEAKTEPTRLRRMAQALVWLAEGKGRNWKYQNC